MSYLDDFAPGGTLWPPYDRNLEVGPEWGISSYVGLASKAVVINDHLPAGVMYMTDREIILSKLGWELLVARIEVIQHCQREVHRIVDRELGDVLEWLRDAGHDV